jgi:hypothetical protein
METLSREQRLTTLELFYLENLVEDPRDGTVFDCDVLDTIKALKLKYADRKENES